MFVVVSYDIVDNRRRSKVHKALKDFGTRVQYSVFECEVDAATFGRMRQRLEPLIDEGEDGVRFYVLCESCKGKVRLMGKGEVTRVRAFEIV